MMLNKYEKISPNATTSPIELATWNEVSVSNENATIVVNAEMNIASGVLCDFEYLNIEYYPYYIQKIPKLYQLSLKNKMLLMRQILVIV